MNPPNQDNIGHSVFDNLRHVLFPPVHKLHACLGNLEESRAWTEHHSLVKFHSIIGLPIHCISFSQDLLLFIDWVPGNFSEKLSRTTYLPVSSLPQLGLVKKDQLQLSVVAFQVQ